MPNKIVLSAHLEFKGRARDMASKTKRKLKQSIRQRRKQLEERTMEFILTPWCWQATVKVRDYTRKRSSFHCFGHVGDIGLIFQVEGERGFWKRSPGGKPVFYDGRIIGVARLNDVESDMVLECIRQMHDNSSIPF